MTWTYTGDPSGNQLDALRLLIGDISGDDPQLTDEELNYFLVEEGSIYGAAVRAVESIHAMYAKQVDKAVGDLKVSYSQRAEAYKNLAIRLSNRASMRLGRPFAGGLSVREKEAQREKLDRVPPRFYREQFRPEETPPELEED